MVYIDITILTIRRTAERRYSYIYIVYRGWALFFRTNRIVNAYKLYCISTYLYNLYAILPIYVFE